ncbi:MAG: polysaccharide deacetylase family protein [bacterium]|nr:polysaccharide deacetylase family protein [bacterium]
MSQQLAGQTPCLLRLLGAPHAPVAQRVAQALGMQAVGYTVNPYDFARQGARMLVERILSQAKPGGVVLLHCGVRQTVEALPVVVEALRKRFALEVLR